MQDLADRPEFAPFRKAIGDVASSVQEIGALNPREQYAAAKLQLERLKTVQVGMMTALASATPPGGPRRDPMLDNVEVAINVLQQLVLAIGAELADNS